MKKQEIADVVRRYATSARFADVGLQVDGAGIRRDGAWWYVPVRPAQPFPRTDLYYAVLADLEEEMDEQEGLNILLVPCSALQETASAA
jgi:hypothetical protein